MYNKISLQNNLLVFGIPLLMILSLVAVVKSSFFIPKLSPYIIVDFLITIPLVYFFLIRKRKITNKTTISVALLGLAIASFILPKEEQWLLTQIKTFLLPLLEMFLIVFLIIKGRKVIKKVKATKDKSLDFFDVVQQVCSDVFPLGVGNVFAAEISVIYYGVLSWKKKVLQENEYSYHKDSTAVSVILGFLLVVIVEMFVTHAMMKQGNVSGSFILGVLSVYSALQVIAILRSLSKRPVFIDVKNKQLILRFGILANASIPFNQIATIELTTKELPENTTIKYFSPLGSSSGHNLVLHLKEELKFNSFYGFSKKATALAIFIDHKNEFKQSLERYV
ncbi:MAG: hypothetical protein ACPGU6_05495 [Tenacibaculum sp.]